MLLRGVSGVWRWDPGCCVTRTPDDRRKANARGAEAEGHVGEALVAADWRIVHRNWHGGGGELDLVVQRDRVVRFVEVRARGASLVPAEETITHGKRARLRRAARAWMEQHPDGWDEVAFLVAIVDLAAEPWEISWLDDAFGG